MTSELHRPLRFAFTLSTLLASASAQEGVPPPPGLVPEKVWPAPTAEDWAKPCLIQWQRNWDDAVEIARQTHRPILVCINMDGEIASEHYAGVRYRQPEITALYEPYVCVIASVYRHNARDYDDEGRRIPCPRFGTVTCGEHIAIEPILFEKFMEGKRIAPRHIMVDLDGEGQPSAKTFDVLLTWDTESVFKAVHDGIANRSEKPLPIVKGDRSILERVASRDSVDRAAVESAYDVADTAQRNRLLDAALGLGVAAPVEILRRAINGFDLDLARKAREGLAHTDDGASVDLIAETLRMPLDPKEKDTLIAALDRLGAHSPRARTLAVVQRGLTSAQGVLDLTTWTSALRGAATYPAPDGDLAAASRLDAAAEALKARAADPLARVALAEALVGRLLEVAPTDPGSRTHARLVELQWQDAERAAQEAERLGAPDWRVSTVLALCAQRRGDFDETYARAARAAKGMPADATSHAAAAVLQLFAEARQDAIATAAKAKEVWPAEWVSDVDSAYGILERHPYGRDLHFANHYDFLQYFGAGQAEAVLEAGLTRFPASALLHERLRHRVLGERGAAALERDYDVRAGREGAPAAMQWFAGYASLCAAEAWRTARKGDEALAAYQRGIARFERTIEMDPSTKVSSDHYVAMALAGRARVLLDAGRLDDALHALEGSFARSPTSAATLDGQNVSGVATARMLRARFEKAERADSVARVDAALGALDPKMLEAPEFERAVDAPPRRRRG